MDRIASFEVDHNKLEKGAYISRIDGDITTYDLRLRKPNCEPVMSNDSIHTIEHLFATYARNSRLADSVIYFGPMGCRTGFYFLLRNANNEDVLDLIRSGFEFISAFQGDIPGASAVECGNYLEHNLEQAKIDAVNYLTVIENWDEEQLFYRN